MRLRYDALDRGLFREDHGIFGEQIGERRGADVGLTAANVQVGLDTAALLGQPTLEFCGAVRDGEPAQRPPQQGRHGQHDQRADQSTTGPGDRAGVTGRCEPSDKSEREHEHTAGNHRGGAYVEERTNQAAQLAQLAVETGARALSPGALRRTSGVHWSRIHWP